MFVKQSRFLLQKETESKVRSRESFFRQTLRRDGEVSDRNEPLVWVVRGEQFVKSRSPDEHFRKMQFGSPKFFYADPSVLNAYAGYAARPAGPVHDFVHIRTALKYDNAFRTNPIEAFEGEVIGTVKPVLFKDGGSIREARDAATENRRGRVRASGFCEVCAHGRRK